MSTAAGLSDAARGTVAQAWGRLVGDPGCFDASGGLRITVRPSDSPGSDGWISWVQVNNATAVSLPASSEPAFVSQVSTALGAREHEVDNPVAAAIFGASGEILGPAALLFLDAPLAHQFGHPVSILDAAAVREAMLPSCTPDDLAEVGLQDATEQMAVVELDGGPVAAAWYEVWQGTLAHISVLVSPGYRSRGLAADVAAATVATACEAGLVAQWRVRTTNITSRRTAARLGFVPMGAQLSLRPAT